MEDFVNEIAGFWSLNLSERVVREKIGSGLVVISLILQLEASLVPEDPMRKKKRDSTKFFDYGETNFWFFFFFSFLSFQLQFGKMCKRCSPNSQSHHTYHTFIISKDIIIEDDKEAKNLVIQLTFVFISNKEVHDSNIPYPS